MDKERRLEPADLNTLRAAVILQDMVDRVSEYERKMEVAESQNLGGFIEIYDRGDEDIDSIVVTRKMIETMKKIAFHQYCYLRGEGKEHIAKDILREIEK